MNTNEIYIIIQEAIKKYHSLFKPDIFYKIRERIDVFDKDVITRRLRIKINKVIKDPPLQSNYERLRGGNSPLPLNMDLTKILSEYFDFRINHDYIFNQVQYSENERTFDQIEHLAIIDFRILQNWFLESQSFYFQGFLDPHAEGNPIVNDRDAKYFLIGAKYGGKIFAKLSQSFYQEFKNRDNNDDQNWVIYGTLKFDFELKANVIHVKKVYFN